MSVYYIHAPDIGFVKIGHAKNSWSRLSMLQVGSPVRLVLLAEEEGGAEIEAKRHTEFAHLRARGEWFRLDGALRRHIDRLEPICNRRFKYLNGALGRWMVANSANLIEVAELLGVDPSTIHKICLGSMIPRDRQLMLQIFNLTNGEVDANALYGLPQKAEQLQEEADAA